MEPGKVEASPLVEAGHEVHRLDGRAGRPLHQVVDRRDDDDEEDGELAEDVSNVLDNSITNFVDRNALAKQKRFVQGSFNPSAPGPGSGGTFGKFRINGQQGSGSNSPVLNSNGKRPAPTADIGYGGGGKGQRT